MIDFGAQPPEINSTRMYAGPGPESLVAAAAAWQALAAGLLASGTGMAITTGALTAGSWTGPSSAMMGISSAQFVAWVLTTAANAEKAAALASGAVGAYDTAFAATIPPWEVERNQITTATLIATNFFGVNSAAIAASEAQYQEYWAQDASAMYSYAAQNQAIAASLAAPPFFPAVPNTNPAGLAGQAASVGQATGEAAGQAGSTASQAGGAVGQMGSSLGSLGSVMSAGQGAMGAVPKALGELTKPFGNMSQFLQPITSMFGQGSQFATPLMSGVGMVAPMMSGLGSAGSLGSLGSGMGGGGNLATPVMAAMGRSPMMGGLTVPQSWTNQVQTVRSVASPEPMGRFAPEWAASGAAEGEPARPPMTGGMGGAPMMAGMAGMNQGSTVGRIVKVKASDALTGVNNRRFN